MRYFKKDPKWNNYDVYCDGDLIENCILADDIEGWCIIEETENHGWGYSTTNQIKRYGRIHIVRVRGFSN